MINLKNITKHYHLGQNIVRALDGINLTIDKGEYIALLGPSGSGKSTLMNILGCLDVPTSGKYELDGRDVTNLSRKELAVVRNKKIGFVFQGFNLLSHANALDNVALPLVYRKINLKARREKAQEVLEQVGLGDRIYHMPNELSGGQQQRVAIARALITEPAIILADEPTGNLDSKSGEAVMDIFDGLIKAGKTILVVTHDEHLAKRMSRIVRIGDGKLISASC